MAAVTQDPVALLHVGMHKTGTTSFQAQLSAHDAELLEGGLLYPSTSRENPSVSHNLLAKELLAARRHPMQIRCVRDLFAEISASGCDRVFISFEELSMAWDRPALLDALRVELEQVGYRVHVLFSRREAESFVPALYGTLVRMGMGIPREDFERQARETGRVVVPRMGVWPKRVHCTDPDEMIESFSAVFGADRLHVVDYTSSGMVARIMETQAWFFRDEAALLSDEDRENVSGDLASRRRLENLLADVQGSRVWRATAWTRSPTARRIRGTSVRLASRLRASSSS